jgi:hypothetical protein
VEFLPLSILPQSEPLDVDRKHGLGMSWDVDPQSANHEAANCRKRDEQGLSACGKHRF